MKILKAPEKFYDQRQHVIFLAGGITNCPDWQKEITSHMEFGFGHLSNVLVANPRRDNFNMADKRATEQQIEWEFKMLQRADAVLFWFPRETLCPITLYELGSYTEKKKHLIIGVDEGYGRKLDVKHQTFHRRPELVVYEGFPKFLNGVAEHLRTVKCEERNLTDEIEV